MIATNHYWVQKMKRIQKCAYNTFFCVLSSYILAPSEAECTFDKIVDDHSHKCRGNQVEVN